jgi:peptide/nickel transport system permease protein
MTDPAPIPRSPLALVLRRLRRRPLALVAGALLALFYLGALLAPFLSPYAPDDMDRARFFHPPQRLRWVDAAGRLHPWPFVYATRPAPGGALAFVEDRTRAVPLRLFVTGAPYRLAGILPLRVHLFGGESPERVNLLGTDPLGRDVLSRLLHGAQVSLSVGLVGIAISFTVGLLLGGLAGYLGGWVDTLIMRLCELLLSIPGLYLLVALRTLFPSDLPSQQVYLAIVAILALLGWAALARVIRGMVLAIRREDYVAAAEAIGLGRLRVLVRHILPNTLSFTIVAVTLAVPGYILGEVVLSFLGVGVQEPSASWGNMLNQARSLRVLTSFPWLLYAPGLAIFLTVMSFNVLGDGLRDALDPRETGGRRPA